MNSKERIRALLEGERVDRPGFWLGNPADETKKIYYDYFGIENDLEDEPGDDSLLLTTKSGQADLELGLKLGNDLMWYSPELDGATWQHPEGKPMFDVMDGETSNALFFE